MPTDRAKNRRRLLKALAGAGGVYTTAKVIPKSWTKPVVDALSLPAHAQTSLTYYGTHDIVQEVTALSPSELDSALDLIVPSANAQLLVSRVTVHICVMPAGSKGMVTVALENAIGPPSAIIFHGMPTVGGGKTHLPDVEYPVGCRPIGISCSCRLDSLNGTADGKIYFMNVDFDFSLPPNPCKTLDVGACTDFSTDDIFGP